MTRPGTARRPLVPKALRRRARRLRARSRLRAANLRGTGAALKRRAELSPPPAVPLLDVAPVGVETTYGAPRTLLTVTVKRDNPHWFDLYGHWWVEAGERSWGWWPREIPVGLRQLARGTDGVLNGTGLVGRRGTWQRDPQHGRRAAHTFHPVLVEPIPDSEVVARLQAYADGYRGGWRWAWTRRSTHDTCRTFQDGLLQAAGLTETLQDLPSRGSGCPFLYPPRTVLWRAQDLLDAARARLIRLPPLTSGGTAGRSVQVLSTYERVSGRYDRYWRRLWLLIAGRAAEKAMLAAVTGAASAKALPRVLDAGAGTGALSRRLAQALPDVHPVLVDISPGMLSHAKDLQDPRAVASVAALPFGDGTFDVVMSAWVIETVDSPSAGRDGDAAGAAAGRAARVLVLLPASAPPGPVADRPDQGGRARAVRRALPARGADAVPRLRGVPPELVRRRCDLVGSAREVLHGRRRRDAGRAPAGPAPLAGRR